MSELKDTVRNCTETVKRSTALKIVLIAVILGLLQIPSCMVREAVGERQIRQLSAENEVAEKWGGLQTVAGPFLLQEIRCTVPAKEKQAARTYSDRYIHLPEDLTTQAELRTEIRYRGLFQIVLYRAQIHIAGQVKVPADRTDFPPDDGVQEKLLPPVLVLGVSDVRGIAARTAKVNGEPAACLPGVPANKLAASGFRILPKTPVAAGQVLDVDVTLELSGSSGVRFLPLGRDNRATVAADWGSPSFNGAFLPRERKIEAKSFTGEWHITDLNRDYPQTFADGTQKTEKSSYGVDLFLPAGVYAQVNRAVRYSVLFILLSLLAYFFAEIAVKGWAHPVQYLLTGLATVMFYALLLSLGEHIGFNAAYIVSSLATAGLAAAYSGAVFGKKNVAFVIGAAMLAAYGLLFVMLKLEDFALLCGTVVLFLLLAVLMKLTGHINRREDA